MKETSRKYLTRKKYSKEMNIFPSEKKRKLFIFSQDSYPSKSFCLLEIETLISTRVELISSLRLKFSQNSTFEPSRIELKKVKLDRAQALWIGVEVEFDHDNT